MPDLHELLARVERATGPDRELDRDLAVALLGWCLHPRDRQRDDSAQSDTGYTCLDCGADSWGNTGPTGQKHHATPLEVTASLDEAVRLGAHFGARPAYVLANCLSPTEPDATLDRIARRCVAALLRALIAQEQKEKA